MTIISRTSRIKKTLITTLAVFSASTALAVPVSAIEKEFDIASQPLPSAIAEFSRQSGEVIVASADVGRGKMSNAVRGTMEPIVALTRLVAGADLRVVAASTGSLVIEAASASQRSTRSINGGQDISRTSFRLAAASAAQGETARVEADSAGGEPQLESVIVTARKRQENLQDVPMSIAVISGAEIEGRGLIAAADYLRGIPGVNQTGNYIGQSIVIRGIETSPSFQNFFGGGGTTATYFGETPTSSTGGLGGGTNVDIMLVDIERVEVLRGPQGTGFGSASLGGAVRTIPMAPNLASFTGRIAGGLSNTSGTGAEGYNVQAVLNVPLITDKLAVRAVGYQYDDSGYYQNRAASSEAFQSEVVIPYGVEDFAVDKDEVGARFIRGGRFSALFQATENLRLSVNILTQKDETDGFAGANSGTYEHTMLQLAPENTSRGQTGGWSDATIDIFNPVIEYSFGWADLVATFSSTRSTAKSASSFGFLGSNTPWSLDWDTDHEEQVGEVRFTTRLEGAWNFLLGAYVEDIEGGGRFEHWWYGSPETNPFGTTDRLVGDDLESRDDKQTAFFGEVSWELMPGLTLTAGARYYDYDRTAGSVASGPVYGDVDIEERLQASGTSPRANLSFKPNADTLIYAGWAEGFRLGLPQTGLPPSLCDTDDDGLIDGTDIPISSTSQVSSDTVSNYELGGKFALLNRRLTLDVAVFRMNWDEVPVTVQPGTGLCNSAYTANAGKARSDGVELQANFQITEAMRLDVGGSWIDAALTNDVPALGAVAGNRLPGGPKTNANLGLQYGFTLAGYKAFVRGDSIYVGSQYGDLPNSEPLTSGDYVKINASAGIAVRNVDLQLYVYNLTNEDAYTFRGVNTLTPFYGFRLKPRQIGLNVAYSF